MMEPGARNDLTVSDQSKLFTSFYRNRPTHPTATKLRYPDAQASSKGFLVPRALSRFFKPRFHMESG